MDSTLQLARLLGMRGVVSARRDLYGRTTSPLEPRLSFANITGLLKAGEVLARLWKLIQSFERVDSQFWIDF